MNIAFIDCFSGISGDMFLGALVDCGLPRKLLKQELAELSLSPYTISFTSEQRMHISGCRIHIKTDKKHHPHRSLTAIKRIITQSRLNQNVKHLSISVFERLAHVESKIHRTKVSEIHFHEVGALDSIIDIVGTAIGIDYFKLDSIYASPLPLGSGFTTSEHGVLPLPAPATLALLKGVPVFGTPLRAELVTPTGAALLTSLTKRYGPMPPMKIARIGYGVGSRITKDRPNTLRIVVGEKSNEQEADQVLILEAHIDDMSPEMYDYLMERLLKKGALDVSFSPLQMKKNRPGVLLKVICSPEKKDECTTIIFQESTTSGIRFYRADRIKLIRKTKVITTPYGNLSVKVFNSPGGGYFASPEYEQCKKIAQKHGIPLKTVYRELTQLLPPLNIKFRL
jgi:uncharacterized protein (TIGR00299 family) protein